MFSRSSFRTLKLLVVVFPIAAGLFLTGLGFVRLYEASERPVSKPLAPYGILAFSSQECEYHSLTVAMTVADTKKNLVDVDFHSDLALKIQDSSFEETFGLQIPYNVERVYHCSVSAFNSLTESMVELEILDENVIFVADYSTSIIYLKFVASPEFEKYRVTVSFWWMGLIIKQGFSNYEVMVPFSTTTLNMVHEHFSNIHPLDFKSIALIMSLPEGSEIRETLPLPNEVTVHSVRNPEGVFSPMRFLSWKLPELPKLQTEAPHPVSRVIRVRFELREEADLRGRLFFDSGLYMGLGISLVFGGIHEAFKIQMELRRKQTE